RAELLLTYAAIDCGVGVSSAGRVAMMCPPFSESPRRDKSHKCKVQMGARSVTGSRNRRRNASAGSSHRMRFVVRVIGKPGVVAQESPWDRGSARTRCVFPLRFRRQPVLVAIVSRIEFVQERVNFVFVHAVYGIARASGLAGVGVGPHHGFPLGLSDFVLAKFEAPGQSHSMARHFIFEAILIALC